MGKVLFGLSVSLDGFIADKNDYVSIVPSNASLNDASAFPNLNA
jgi:hypothetical protein